MAKVELNNVSLTFHVRQHKRASLKEYLVRRMFRPGANPRMAVRRVVPKVQFKSATASSSVE